MLRRHQLLREATQVVHGSLERAVDGARFFQCIDGYGRYLERLRLFYGTLERCLGDGAKSWLRTWEFGQHIMRLDADLAGMRLKPLPEHAAQAFRMPVCSDESGRLGALYVVLGSSLGARLLVRHARALSPVAATAYLESLSASRVWPQYLVELEGSSVDSEARLLAGALTTFDSVHDHLVGPLPT